MIISSILNDINLSSNVEISIYCTNNNIKSKEVILSNVMVLDKLTILFFLSLFFFFYNLIFKIRINFIFQYQKIIIQNYHLLAFLVVIYLMDQGFFCNYLILIFLHLFNRYPYFTMLFQMLAMIYIGLICIYYYIPDIYLDTTGVPFMYPIFKLFQCQVVTYIHYPILSSVSK